MKIDVLDNQGYKSTYESKYDVVGLNISMPNEVIVGRTANFSAQYKNTKENDSEIYFVYAITDEQDIIEDINNVGTRDIVSGGLASFNWNWIPKKTGIYAARMYLYEADTVLEFLEINLTSFVENIAEINSVTITPNIVEKGKNLTIDMSVQNIDTNSINGSIELNLLDSNQKIISLATLDAKNLGPQSETIFKYDLKTMIPGGNYTLVSKLHYGNRMEEKANSFEVITPKTGKINSIYVPKFDVETNKAINITFQNTENVPLRVEIKGDIIDGQVYDVQKNSSAYNILDHVYFGKTDINATSASTFTANWTAFKIAGNYTMNTKAYYEGNLIENYTKLEITDTLPPNIVYVNYTSQIAKNNPFIAFGEISDNSGLSLTKLVVTAPNGTKFEAVHGNISNKFKISFLETLASGLYTFYVRSCDTYSNCVSTRTFNFTVLPCTGKSILIISTKYDNKTDSFSEALTGKYCLSVWNKMELDSPEISYLKRFDVIVWSTGNTPDNSLTGKDIAVLENYTLSG